MEMGIVAKYVDDCFAALGTDGKSAFIPPLSATCRHAPNRECVLVTPETATGKPWEYQIPSRTESPEWHALKVQKIFKIVQDYHTTQTHHIRFGWSNAKSCRFEIEAVADVDDDGYWATRIRRYALNVKGELEYSGGDSNSEEPSTRDLPGLGQPPPDAIFTHQPSRASP